jgi:ComF family protein
MSGLSGPAAKKTDRDRNIPRTDGFARIYYWAQERVDTTLDWLFPPKCVHCQRQGTLWCSICQQAIELPLDPMPEDLPTGLSGRCATALFGGSIQSAIHALKYKQNRRMAVALAGRLAVTFRTTGWTPTLLTAVPLHAERLRERGYNQSVLLAARLSITIGVPFQARAVQRVKATRPQVGLNYRDRQTNVAGAFAADRAIVAGQSIVVIDDVYTTGATLVACADALRAAGAQHVWALTVASAIQRDGDETT